MWQGYCVLRWQEYCVLLWQEYCVLSIKNICRSSAIISKYVFGCSRHLGNKNVPIMLRGRSLDVSVLMQASRIITSTLYTLKCRNIATGFGVLARRDYSSIAVAMQL